MGDSKAEQNLVLKVMRMTRPTFALASSLASFSPVTSNKVIAASSPPSERLEDPISNFVLSEALVVPQNFESIYLGETFSCYVSLHNDSTETCDSLILKYDLQTATQRLPLLAPSSMEAENQIVPGASVDHVLSHEVKELGSHILVCEVSYNVPLRGGRMNFRKYFKFQVMKPLDIKTKFYNAESDDVFLEAEVENITSNVLYLESVCLEPSTIFKVIALNHIPIETPIAGDTSSPRKQLVFGKVNCLQPHNSRRYLFSLMPKRDLKMNNKQSKTPLNIGKLDIVWRTNMGDRGRLQTSQLPGMTPNHGDIRLSVETIPNIVFLDKVFHISCLIINNSERTLDLELKLENVNTPGLLWTGITVKKLGLIVPAGSTEIELEAVPQDTGLQVISGIRIEDSLLMRTYSFDGICQVYVVKDENLVSS